MNPTEQYSERLRQREHGLARYDRLLGQIGTARLSVAAAFLALVWWSAERGSLSAVWLSLPVSLFVALVVYHQRLRGLRGRALRAVVFYRTGLARLRGEAAGLGSTGLRFSDEHHLYAADLDLFGAHGLYERLCVARTPMGEATLATWLLDPAEIKVIRDRQTCVRELRGRLDLREDLAIGGEPEHITVRLDVLMRWTQAPDELSSSALVAGASALVALAGVTAAAWAIWGVAFPFLAVLVIEAALNYALRQRVQRCVAGIEGAYEDLTLLSTLLRRIEADTFECPALRALKQRLASHALPASLTLAKLATVVNFVEARRNPFLTPLMLPLLYTIHSALAAERWRRRHGQVVAAWLDVLGTMEALLSIAGYSFERPEDPFPEFTEGAAHFSATGLGHPLIAAGERVRNDVDIAGEVRVLLVSGSNMSGKSTLLRSVGINTVLAMAGAPVCATRLELTPLQVGASIRVNDSLAAGKSRFYAEITRLRQLFEPQKRPLLFLLDELLQGTNSADRRVGAEGVVRALIATGAIGLVSTHDLALTGDNGTPPGTLRNVHFQDELHDGKLAFDFKLREGVVTHSNGIELMRAIGLNV